MHRTRIAETTLMLQVTSAVAHREARTHGRFSLALLRHPFVVSQFLYRARYFSLPFSLPPPPFLHS